MSDEIKIGVQMSITNGLFKDSFAPGTINVNQGTQGAHSSIVTVGSTAEEDLVTGDIGTLGWAMGRNLDSSNYVTVGPSTGGPMHPFQRIKAGEPFAFRLEPGITWRWRANTADVKVLVKILED
jgi:hypothetical protein